MTATAFPHVEIFGLRISGPTTTYGIGKPRLDFSTIGSFRIFVDVVEADGARMSMWDGSSYEEAIINAEELSSDGFGPVVDSLVGGRAW